MTMKLFILVFTALISVGGGFNDYDYYQLDYHRPRDREIALHLQAKAVKNQGSLNIFTLRSLSSSVRPVPPEELTYTD